MDSLWALHSAATGSDLSGRARSRPLCTNPAECKNGDDDNNDDEVDDSDGEE